ncbi:DUF3575 domain-containing protein [Dysgonomonas sp. 511]|uniref:DUF3575 domain-containing protein n=1 Tax=Dysgonomonas sp. 511 TaxID=2302930 RepID=UPI0013D7C41E|nr:DUF3575 domain-containing protein [Dysgonomonas sp. 511]
MNNAHTLEIINQMFANVILEEDDFIVITSAASPEGGFDNNEHLAKERAISLKNYIRQKFPHIKDSQFITFPLAENWDGMKELIEKDDNVPARKQLLKILESKLSRESQKIRIKRLNDGKTYAYLLEHILPYLRGSATTTIYSKRNELHFKKDTIEIVRVDTVCFDPALPKTKRPFVMAIRNNLIYDAALLPNLAIEIPFGRDYRWSVGIEGNWSWWNTNANTYYYHRIQMAGVELRHWFGNKAKRPLTGWYLGAYGYGGTYDVRLFTKKKSDMGQLSNWSYSAGLTLGYSMRISKRFNLEFGIGAGYFGGKYHKYNVSDCAGCTFPKRSTHDRKYWGPTKAGISLVWLIGNVNQNKKTEEQQR